MRAPRGSRGSGLAVAAAAAALVVVGGSASATADRGGGRGGVLPPSPCLQWGDLVPVELTLGHARAAIVCLVNRERAAYGLRRLEPNLRLQRAAKRHTAQMDGTGCFRHRCPGELRLRQRLGPYFGRDPKRFKYGEALAWGPEPLATPREIVAALMTSTRHRFHLLRPVYDEVGVGFTVGTPESAGDVGGIYTIDLGMRID